MDVNACDKCGKTAPPQILNTHKFGICVGCGFPIVRGDEFDNARLEAVQGQECHLNMPERIHATRTISCLKMPEYRPSYVTALDVINAHKRDAFKAEQAQFKSFHDQADAVVLVERPIKEDFAAPYPWRTIENFAENDLGLPVLPNPDFKDAGIAYPKGYDKNGPLFQFKSKPPPEGYHFQNVFPTLDTFRESFKEAVKVKLGHDECVTQPNIELVWIGNGCYSVYNLSGICSCGKPYSEHPAYVEENNKRRYSFFEQQTSQPLDLNLDVNTKHNLKINENVVNFFKKFKWTNER